MTCPPMTWVPMTWATVAVRVGRHGRPGRRWLPNAPGVGTAHALLDGVDEIKLWGEKYPVRAKVHTIGGLSAHADQADLLDWYEAFENRPPVFLVHGEADAQKALAAKLKNQFGASVTIAAYEQKTDI